jgi:nicotinamidase-related amidase
MEKYYIGNRDSENLRYKNFDNSLLFVIDLQERLMPAVDKSGEIIKNTAALLKVFNWFSIKSLATEQYPKGLGRSVESILSGLKEENIFSKTSFNGLTEEVRAYLKENKIKKVFVTGAESHICVFQTVRALIDLGLEVFAVEDGISSYSKEYKELGLKAMEAMGAVRINTEMLLYDLANDSKNPRFKEITKLVKDLRNC